MKRWIQGAIVATATLAAWAPLSPSAVERRYSARLYPEFQRGLTSLTNLLPVAVFDVLLVTAVTAVLVGGFRALRAARRQRRAHPVGLALWNLGIAAALLYLLFLAAWGLNYRREPLQQRLVLRPGSPSDAEVLQLGLDAAARMNDLHARAHAADAGGGEWRNDGLRRAFASVQGDLGDAVPAAPGRLKETLVGPYFRWTSVDGMINPFGLEVLVNPDLLPFERPFVAAHEWAHLAGRGDESEANFVGWLACLRAGPAAEYSAWMFLFWQVNGEVREEDRGTLAAALAEGPRRDVDAIVSRIRRGSWPMLQTAGWAVYDQYLKANRVEEGIRSYGAVVTLILQARFEAGWVPVRARGAAR